MPIALTYRVKYRQKGLGHRQEYKEGVKAYFGFIVLLLQGGGV